MLTGAIIGGIVGLLMVFIMAAIKENKRKSIAQTEPDAEYAALYHYAPASQYNKGMKFYQSYGLLYLKGATLYYKADRAAAPLEFDLHTSDVQAEPDWRLLKWFSVTTPVGEKHYFNSHKMGGLKNDSSETDRGLATLLARKKELAATA